jgi:hypothetical protein
MISGSNMLVSKARRGGWLSVKINEFCAVKCIPCSSAADFEAFISHKPRLQVLTLEIPPLADLPMYCSEYSVLA